jgi:hypothetical protein
MTHQGKRSDGRSEHDPFFEFFQTNVLKKTVPKETIKDLHLNPIFIDNLPDDNLSKGFLVGGNILANLDWIFNINKDVGQIFLDISREQQGASEYWLWKNPNNIAYVEKTANYSEFRSDISELEKRIYLNDISTANSIGDVDTEALSKTTNVWFDYWIKENESVFIVGSSDIPKDIELLTKQLQIAFSALVPRGVFFFLLPDDKNVEKIIANIKDSCQYITVLRLISSPFPVLYGQKGLAGAPKWKTIKNGEKTEPMKSILPKKYYNFKKFSMILGIPYSLPYSG